MQRGLVDGLHAVPAPIVHVQDNGSAGSPIAVGAAGWALVVTPAPDEPVMTTDSDDAFERTLLQEELRTRGVDRLAVAGIQSEMCVAATARGALTRGLAVVVPRGAHPTYDLPATSYEPRVPAVVVARVAVWSLGDEVEVPDLDDLRW